MGLFRSMFTLDADSGMSDRDRITLSPIEKWRQYNRFPFKLVVHAMLLALTTIQVREKAHFTLFEFSKADSSLLWIYSFFS